MLAAAVFSIWPSIDLAASRLFYAGRPAFPAARSDLADLLRKLVWSLSGVVALGSLALWIASLAGRRLLGVPGRVWGFVTLLYVIAPGLIVDVLLKSHWGRARPADIADFGGDRAFTPALMPTDQCADNCSFVSGEGSGAVTLAVAVFVITAALAGRVPARALQVIRILAAILAVTASALRVAAGRHFLSDTVFAVLIVFAVALALHRLLLAPARSAA
jgi:membrane-associated PAP2 superfamily phosphatase